MFDLISIVFRDEIQFLQTQAKSISKYLPAKNINQIRIVVNDTDDVCELIDTSWWGDNAHKVVITPVSAWNLNIYTNGWESQQLCKLLAAAESNTEWSYSLDAKTWFVNNLDIVKCFPNGKYNSGTLDVFPVFEPAQQFVQNLYNIKMPKTLGPGGVPFMFHTKTVKALVDSIEDFPTFFQNSVTYPNHVTEYYLYSGYVLHTHGTYSKLYNDVFLYDVVNIAHFEIDKFDEYYATRFYKPNVLTASIHRAVYAGLTTEQLEQWDKFLTLKGII